MKIIATSCWHLDKVVGGYDLHKDIVRAAEQVIDATGRADLFVHCGDLFDNNKPSPRAYATAIRLIGELDCPGVFIAGNHDPDTLAPLMQIQATAGFPKRMQFVSQPETLAVDGKLFYMLGHPPGDWRQSHIDEAFESLRVASLDDMDDQYHPVDAVFTHLNIDGAKLGEGVRMSAHDLGLPLKLSRKLPCSIIAGHIHEHQRIEPNIHIPGSLVRANMGERDQTKGFLELEV